MIIFRINLEDFIQEQVLIGKQLFQSWFIRHFRKVELRLSLVVAEGIAGNLPRVHFEDAAAMVPDLVIFLHLRADFIAEHHLLFQIFLQGMQQFAPIMPGGVATLTGENSFLR